jgi:hypothetical protein
MYLCLCGCGCVLLGGRRSAQVQEWGSEHHGGGVAEACYGGHEAVLDPILIPILVTTTSQNGKHTEAAASSWRNRRRNANANGLGQVTAPQPSARCAYT